MKKISVTGVVILAMLSIAISSCALSQAKNARNGWNDRGTIAGDHFSEVPDFDIPIVVNDKVIVWIEYFQGRGRKYFVRYLERSGRYVPMMRKILKEHGLPEDLVYLSMIESGFNPHAYSRARASGPWQFMYRTGARYGLRVDDYIDERLDPEKATIAAARHLKDLYDTFNDWNLAAAGYNAGEGKIRRAIKRYDTEDFWELTKGRYLKSETKNYVPKMIAAAIMAKNPKKYGFDDIKYEEPVAFETAIINDPADIGVIAKCTGVDASEIKNLNPELKSWMTPMNYPGYKIKVPEGSLLKFNELFAALTPEERLPRMVHVVKRGECLGNIARRYGVTTTLLARANNIRNIRHISPGQKLMVPRKTWVGKEYAKRERTSERRNKKPTYYLIRPGDSLWLISKRFGVSVRDLKSWNPGVRSGVVKSGQRLALIETGNVETRNKRGSSEYVVKSGESLWIISKKLGISINELARLNPNINLDKLHPGQELRIEKETSASSADLSKADTNQPTSVVAISQ